MNFNSDYSSPWNLTTAFQQYLPDNFKVVDQWKNLDFTNPENIKKLATSENCTMIISLLKSTGYLSEEQVYQINSAVDFYQNSDNLRIVDEWKNLDFTKPETIQDLANNENCNAIISLLKISGYLSEENEKLLKVSVAIYKNEEWKNWDWNDPKAIKDFANNPNCDLIIDAMKTSGYLNAEQIKSLKSKIKFILKTPQMMSAFKKDLNDLQNVSKLQIFKLGESKVNAINPGSRWNVAATFGCAAIALVTLGISVFIATNSQENPTIIHAGKNKKVILPFMASVMSAGVLFVQKEKIYRHAENCMIEGYYLKTKEIVEKHFQKSLGDEGVEFILANLKDKLSYSN
ncbi:MAG TPA: hypothetical protein VGP47_00310, partial [Parachlamydiaceae bacterium]|nr:hypothetical protein [Parachlamydiaceae bacterium]